MRVDVGHVSAAADVTSSGPGCWKPGMDGGEGSEKGVRAISIGLSFSDVSMSKIT